MNAHVRVVYRLRVRAETALGGGGAGKGERTAVTRHPGAPGRELRLCGRRAAGGPERLPSSVIGRPLHLVSVRRRMERCGPSETSVFFRCLL